LSESFSELSDTIKSYVDSRIRYWKIQFLAKSTRAVIYLQTTVVVLLLLLTFVIMLGFAFSFWYGARHGELWVGFLISSGGILLLTLLVFLFRKQLFSRNAIRNLRKLILPEDEEE